MSPNRLTWAYKKKLFKGFDPSYAILKKYETIYKEINKTIFQKIKGIIFLIVKGIVFLMIKEKRSGYSDNRDKLFAKIGLFFKNENISKDLEYKSILKFVLDNIQ